MRIILTLSQLQLTMDGPVSASELVHLRQVDDCIMVNSGSLPCDHRGPWRPGAY